MKYIKRIVKKIIQPHTIVYEEVSYEESQTTEYLGNYIATIKDTSDNSEYNRSLNRKLSKKIFGVVPRGFELDYVQIGDIDIKFYELVNDTIEVTPNLEFSSDFFFYDMIPPVKNRYSFTEDQVLVSNGNYGLLNLKHDNSVFLLLHTDNTEKYYTLWKIFVTSINICPQALNQDHFYFLIYNEGNYDMLSFPLTDKLRVLYTKYLVLGE